MPSQNVIYLVTFVTREFLFPDGRPAYPPVAALYLASALRKAGFEPRVLHLLPEHLDQLCQWMETERPLFVGFTTLTCSMLLPSLEASGRARELGIPVVWGGVHATILPELCVADAADYVVIGEGDETVGELAIAIAGEGGQESILGVVHFSKGEIKRGSRRTPVEDLEQILPAWDLIDPSQYLDLSFPGGGMPFLL